ncbi:MAG: M48 family metallopeptidase [Verrucomicrobiota bacterium]
MIQSVRLIALLSATFVLTIGCSTVPETGRRAFNFIPPNQEKAMGLTAFQKYKETRPVSSHPEYNAAVKRVASRLVRVVDIPGAEWEFVVFEDESPNAFALPGGKVGIHTGLFKVVQNDAQLAAVVGHEIGHIIARHGGQRLSKSMTVAGVGAVAAAAMNRSENVSDSQKLKILAAYGAGSTVGIILPHSRKQEIEADKLGVIYMARAGYDPREAVNLWVNFAEYKAKNGGPKVPDFLSTHPVDATRIRELESYIPRVQDDYRRASVTRTLPAS